MANLFAPLISIRLLLGPYVPVSVQIPHLICALINSCGGISRQNSMELSQDFQIA